MATTGDLDFDAAVRIVDAHKGAAVPINTQLMLYGYFKVGRGLLPPAAVPATPIGRTKQLQWKAYADKYTQDEARARYVALVKLLLGKRVLHRASHELMPSS